MSKHPHLEGIPVLTVKQPFAALILLRHFSSQMKHVENRTWKTDYRGPILICASVKPKFTLQSVYDKCWDVGVWAQPSKIKSWFKECPAIGANGALIGGVTLECILKDDRCSPWGIRGENHWLLSAPQPFKVAIPYKGHLGLRQFDPTRVKEVSGE